jgi:hypothetical protein
MGSRSSYADQGIFFDKGDEFGINHMKI